MPLGFVGPGGRFDSRGWMRSVRSAVRPAMVAGLKLAGAAVAADIRRRIAVEGPPPSEPGRPPHVDAGVLVDSIWWEVDEANLRVYVVADTPYAYYLEFGTARMAPRPFMRRGLGGSIQSLACSRVAAAFAAPRTPVDESRMWT